MSHTETTRRHADEALSYIELTLSVPGCEIQISGETEFDMPYTKDFEYILFVLASIEEGQAYPSVRKYGEYIGHIEMYFGSKSRSVISNTTIGPR